MPLIIPRLDVAGRLAPVDVGPLAHVLISTDPDLWASVLPGESLMDARARRDAAADILDELLYEAAEEVAA